jgi:hypothetical protein
MVRRWGHTKDVGSPFLGGAMERRQVMLGPASSGCSAAGSDRERTSLLHVNDPQGLAGQEADLDKQRAGLGPKRCAHGESSQKDRELGNVSPYDRE